MPKWSYFFKQLTPPLVLSVIKSLKPPQRVSKDLYDKNLQFSVDWFTSTRDNWDRILNDLKPSHLLEVGAFEGMSTCYIISRVAINHPIEIHCVDTWEGGIEHHSAGSAETNMSAVELLFDKNLDEAMKKVPHKVILKKHKCFSHQGLSNLITEGFEGYFDLAYIDGSHQAPDVLVDSVLTFKLTRVGGIIIFDDYLWEEELPGGTDPLRCPKPAIDAFVNLYIRKLKVL